MKLNKEHFQLQLTACEYCSKLHPPGSPSASKQTEGTSWAILPSKWSERSWRWPSPRHSASCRLRRAEHVNPCILQCFRPTESTDQSAAPRWGFRFCHTPRRRTYGWRGVCVCVWQTKCGSNIIRDKPQNIGSTVINSSNTFYYGYYSCSILHLLFFWLTNQSINYNCRLWKPRLTFTARQTDCWETVFATAAAESFQAECNWISLKVLTGRLLIITEHWLTKLEWRLLIEQRPSHHV